MIEKRSTLSLYRYWHISPGSSVDTHPCKSALISVHRRCLFAYVERFSLLSAARWRKVQACSECMYDTSP